jgi:hypothetical protein
MIKNFYYNYFSQIETTLVISGTIFVTYLNHMLSFLKVPSDDFLYMYLESMIGLLGFVIAFTAIIFSLQKSKKLTYFQGMNSYKKVFSVFTTAIAWMTLSILLIMGNFLINTDIASFYIIGLVLFSTFITLVKVARCVWVTSKMFALSASK